MTDRDGYLTLSGPGEAAFEVRGSEFIGHARPVDGREAAEAFLDAVRARYDDATHNVPAYRVREDQGQHGHLLREYQHDDGEPTGSAGKPALNVLQRRDIENVAVVVTRYYGGTNLGVGGLARAYSRAVKEAVDDGGVIEERPQERFTVTVEYDDSGTVRAILESSDVDFEATYEETVTFAVKTAVEDGATVRDRIRSATSGRADLG
ncbi:MAG: YigZ family protein [Halanaeroarchaeum sp.]